MLAYPPLALIARSPKKHRDLLLLLVILPFWSNFLIRVYAWMIILGPNAAFARAVNGLLGVFGIEPVSLLSSFRCARVPRLRAPAVHGAAALRQPREARPHRCSTPRRTWARARGSASGASRSLCSLPGVYAGAALVFIPAFGIFAIPDILGGPDDSLIGNVIKQQFLETRDWPFGSVLSIVLTVLARSARGRPRGSASAASAAGGDALACDAQRRSRSRPVGRGFAYAFLYLPLVIVVVYSFNDSRLNAAGGWASRSTGTANSPTTTRCCRRGQLAAHRVRGEPRVDRSSARWPGSPCTATTWVAPAVLVLTPIAIPGS